MIDPDTVRVEHRHAGGVMNASHHARTVASSLQPGTERPGWGPRRPHPAPRDSAVLTTLRVLTYVLTSLASLLFIALVIYGAVRLGQFQTALDRVTEVVGR